MTSPVIKRLVNVGSDIVVDSMCDLSGAQFVGWKVAQISGVARTTAGLVVDGCDMSDDGVLERLAT